MDAQRPGKDGEQLQPPCMKQQQRKGHVCAKETQPLLSMSSIWGPVQPAGCFTAGHPAQVPSGARIGFPV